MPADHELDPLDRWLNEQVRPLPPPSGTFELITKRARRRLGEGTALPLHLAPVITDQVRGDHVEVALRAVELVDARPLRQQPDERLGGDLVRGVVVVHQPPDPARELRVVSGEQLFRECPSGAGAGGDGGVGARLRPRVGAHRASLCPRCP